MSRPWGFIDESGWYLISGICGETLNTSVQNYIVGENNGAQTFTINQAWCLRPNSDGRLLADGSFNDQDHSGPAPGFLTVDHWKSILPNVTLTKNLGIWAEIDTSFAQTQAHGSVASSILGNSTVTVYRFDRISKTFIVIATVQTDPNTGTFTFSHRAVADELYSIKATGGNNTVNGLPQACEIMTLRKTNASGHLGEVIASPSTTIVYGDIEVEINNGTITDIATIVVKMNENRTNLQQRLNLTSPDIIDTGYLNETDPNRQGDVAKISRFHAQTIQGIRAASNMLNLVDNSLNSSNEADNNDIMSGIRNVIKESISTFNYDTSTIDNIMQKSISIKGQRLDQIRSSASFSTEQREQAQNSIATMQSNWGLQNDLTAAVVTTNFNSLQAGERNTIENIKNLWQGVSNIIDARIDTLETAGINNSITVLITQMAEIEIAVEGSTSFDNSGNIIGGLNPVVSINDNSGSNTLIQSISGNIESILTEASNNNLGNIDASNAIPPRNDTAYTKIWAHIDTQLKGQGHPGLMRTIESGSSQSGYLKNPSIIDKFNLAIDPSDVPQGVNSILNPNQRHYAFVYVDLSALEQYLYTTATLTTPPRLNGINLRDYFYGPIVGPIGLTQADGGFSQAQTNFDIIDLSASAAAGYTVTYNIDLVDVSQALYQIKEHEHMRDVFNLFYVTNRPGEMPRPGADIANYSLYLVTNIDIMPVDNSMGPPIQGMGTSILFHLYTRGVGHTGDNIHPDWIHVGEESVHYKASYAYIPYLVHPRDGDLHYVYWLALPDISYSGVHSDLRVDGTFDESSYLLTLDFKNFGSRNSRGDVSHNQYCTIIELTRDYNDASGLGFLSDSSDNYINVTTAYGAPSQIKYYPKARLNITRNDLSNCISYYNLNDARRNLYIDSNELINQYITSHDTSYGVHFGWGPSPAFPNFNAALHCAPTGGVSEIIEIQIDFSNTQILKYGTTYGVFFDVPNMYRGLTTNTTGDGPPGWPYNNRPTGASDTYISYKGSDQYERNDLYDFPNTNNVFIFTVGPEPPEPGGETFTLEVDQSDFTLKVKLNQSITDSGGIGSIQLDISGINGISLEDITLAPEFDLSYGETTSRLRVQLNNNEIQILQPAYFDTTTSRETIYNDVSNGGQNYMRPIDGSGLLLTIDATKIADNTKLEFVKSNCKITKFNNDYIDGSNSGFRDISNVFDNYLITYGVPVDKLPFFTDSSLIQVFASNRQVYLVLPSINNLHNDLQYFRDSSNTIATGIQSVVCLAFNTNISDLSLNDADISMTYGRADEDQGIRQMNQVCLNTRLVEGQLRGILPAYDNRQAIYSYFIDGYNTIPQVTGLYMKIMYLTVDPTIGPHTLSYIINNNVFGNAPLNNAQYVDISNINL